MTDVDSTQDSTPSEIQRAQFAQEAAEFRRRVDEYEARVPPHLRGTFVATIHEAGAQLRVAWTRELLKSWTTRILVGVGDDLLKMSTVVLPPLGADELREIERTQEVPLYPHQPRPLVPGHPRLTGVRIVQKKVGFHEYLVAIGTREIPCVALDEWTRVNARLGVTDPEPLRIVRRASYSLGNSTVLPTQTSAAAAAALSYRTDIEWAVAKVRQEFEALSGAGVRLKPPRTRLLASLRLAPPALRPEDAEFLSDETIQRAVVALARPRKKGNPGKDVCSPGEALLGVWCEMGIEPEDRNGRAPAIRAAQTWIDRKTAPSEHKKRLAKALDALGVRSVP